MFPLSLACVDGIWHPARELPHVVFCFNCLNMELVNQGHEVQLIVYHMLFIYRQYCLGRYGNRITFKHSLHTAWQYNADETAIFTNQMFSVIKTSSVYLCDASISSYQLYFVVLREIHVFFFFVSYLVCIHCHIEPNVLSTIKMAVVCKMVSLNFDLILAKYLRQKTQNFLLTQFY
jgi:hypothetical protein